MANIKEYIKKIKDGTVSLEEQMSVLAQVEKTIAEEKKLQDEFASKKADMVSQSLKIAEEKKQRDGAVRQKVDMVVKALKTIESKLEAKLVELNNTPAMQGVQGSTGKAGKDGVDGKDGRDGVSGKDGKDGKDGVDGKDGISVVDAKIDFDGSLVIYLSDGSEIDCGQILSPDVAQNIIINSGGSGTSQAVTDTIASLQAQINALTGIDGTLGTMAQQDANAVAITGGTINGTTIGDVTPNTVNATTITGQTARLNGTGQNLFIWSQEFDNTSGWTREQGGTGVLPVITANADVAPDGTTTADQLVFSLGGGTTSADFSWIRQTSSTNPTYVVGVTYIQSVWMRTLSGTASVIMDLDSANTNIASVTTTWQRFTFSRTASALARQSRFGLRGGTGSSTTATVLMWGAQFELGSTVGTYIPTTSTSVYGTPTLSFSGVSSIGLLSNGALYLQPAGTGALQAQATTSTTAGGNARGANAVDWQTSRGAATNVASATSAFIGAGSSNTATGNFSGVVSGLNNNPQSTGNFIGAGNGNSTNSPYSSVVGGVSNQSLGYYNFIGGGFTNSGTANAAVTTQSATMNGTTAVTLSGSNANIKVGQYITGTSIASDTYVAAISGTALTLSKVASGSSTSTLSFFTPHGVVVGGGNNQATGSYSFIGGGGDAGTAANRNVASGDWSFVGGGTRNTASGISSVICGGGSDGGSALGNTASGISSTVLGGASNTVTADYSVVGGRACVADGNRSVALGNNVTTRSIAGNFALSGGANPIAGSLGITQAAILTLARQTTDATPTALASNGSAAGTTNQVILPNNSAYYFKGSIVANVTGAANGAAWSFEGAIMRGANAASTVLMDTPSVNRVAASSGATAWSVAITADTTNGGLRVTVTGVTGTTIRWVAKVETTEVTF